MLLQVPLCVVLLVALWTSHFINNTFLNQVSGLMVLITLSTMGFIVTPCTLEPLSSPVPLLMLQKGIFKLKHLIAIGTLLRHIKLLVYLHMFIKRKPPLKHFPAFFAWAGFVKDLFLFPSPVGLLRFSCPVISWVFSFHHLSVFVYIIFLYFQQIGLVYVLPVFDKAFAGVSNEDIAVWTDFLLAAGTLVLEHV